MASLTVGVIGYGVAGEFFHVPFIRCNPDLELIAISTSDAERASRASRFAPVVSTAEDLLQKRPDIVVVATPPHMHSSQSIAALEVGSHVIVDKPFARDESEARKVFDVAAREERRVFVYQNRRFDRDFRTVQRLVGLGLIGKPHTFESHFEWWKPEVDSSWKSNNDASMGGGLLLDLGPHLVDQAVQLFGPVSSVAASRLRTLREGSSSEDDVFIILEHETGVQSRLSMSAVAAEMGPRFRVLGDSGAITVWGLDEQEDALRKRGMSPSDPDFVYDSRILELRRNDGTLARVPMDVGSYGEFYQEVVSSLIDGTKPPVTEVEAVEVMRILDMARAVSSQ